LRESATETILANAWHWKSEFQNPKSETNPNLKIQKIKSFGNYNFEFRYCLEFSA
jgi:hypothetical protein